MTNLHCFDCGENWYDYISDVHFGSTHIKCPACNSTEWDVEPNRYDIARAIQKGQPKRWASLQRML